MVVVQAAEKRSSVKSYGTLRTGFKSPGYRLLTRGLKVLAVAKLSNFLV